MAAALVPLILGVAPEIINLITSLVHRHAPVVEATGGAGTGPVKFADVFGAVITDLTNAANVGSISKQLPSDDSIKVIIQAVVSSMKLNGLLDGPTAATVAPAQSLVLKAGQSITIMVQQ